MAFDLNQTIDEGRFALELSQERKARGLSLAFAGVIMFDPKLHPRDLKGRFQNALGGLADGQSLQMPDGTKVTRKGTGFDVHPTRGASRNARNAGEATTDALNKSASSKHPDSVGGGKSFKNLDNAFNAHAAKYGATETDSRGQVVHHVNYEASPRANQQRADSLAKPEHVVRESKNVPGAYNVIKPNDGHGEGQGGTPTPKPGKKPDNAAAAIGQMGPRGSQTVINGKQVTRTGKDAYRVEGINGEMAGADAVAALNGDSAGTDEVHDVGADVNKAADLLSQGKKVHLDQPRTASVLLGELAKRVQAAKDQGESAPNFDLCKVTVKNTNLFCAESKGIPRVKMPQVKGVPTPGSKADSMPKNAKGEVDLSGEFRKMLEARGVQIQDTTEKASHLRASQIELNGGKVAGMTQAMEAGKIPDEHIFVSHDNYIVDGHHRWAAKVGLDLQDNKLGDINMPVSRINMDIIQLLDESNKFASDWGIPQAGVEAQVPGDQKPGAAATGKRFTSDGKNGIESAAVATHLDSMKSGDSFKIQDAEGGADWTVTKNDNADWTVDDGSGRPFQAGSRDEALTHLGLDPQLAHEQGAGGGTGEPDIAKAVKDNLPQGWQYNGGDQHGHEILDPQGYAYSLDKGTSGWQVQQLDMGGDPIAEWHGGSPEAALKDLHDNPPSLNAEGDFHNHGVTDAQMGDAAHAAVHGAVPSTIPTHTKDGFRSRAIGELDAGTPNENSPDGHVAAVLSAIDSQITQDDPQWDQQITDLYDAVKHGGVLTTGEQELLVHVLQTDVQDAKDNGMATPGGPVEKLDTVINMLTRGKKGHKGTQ